MDYGMHYIHDHQIAAEDSYKYTALDGKCKSPLPTPRFAPCNDGTTGFADIPARNCDAQKTALLKQPIAVAVDANNWSPYHGGIFNNCGKSLDHGVLLVGMTDTYWIVKNSWGAAWGE